MKALSTAVAWMFGIIPRSIVEDIQAKHPETALHRFHRGPSIDLSKMDSDGIFVPIVECYGWAELRQVRS